MKARKLYSQGSRWTDTTVRAAFPIALRRAMDGDTIEYGELNEELVTRGKKSVLPIAYRYVAGKIGDVCEALADDMLERVPPLNAIIINAKSRLPSHGVDSYLVRFLGKDSKSIVRLKKADRDDYARNAIEAVHNFDGWDRVREHLRISVADVRGSAVNRGRPIRRPDPKKFSSGPESAAHKALKLWVRDRPDVFANYGKFRPGCCEKTISSGDRLDVLFENGKTMLAVEVKAKNLKVSTNDEIQRGVFQCVKYRATLRAMQLADSSPPNAQAILVLDHSPSSEVSHLATRLSVHVMNVEKML